MKEQLSKVITKSIDEFIKTTLNCQVYSILPLAGDASSRQYFRLSLDKKPYVLMVWDAFEDKNFPFLSVHNLFEQNHIKVPKILNYSSELGTFLLEDLGDLTLERLFWQYQDQEKILPYYYQSLDELIKIHYHTSKDAKKDCTAFKISFDTEKLLWELNYGLKHLIKDFLKIELSPTQEAQLAKEFTDICSALDKEPKFIAHRDYHSRNLMFKDGEIVTIDFQDARLGPIQYDLVSLLKDSYVDLDSDIENKLLNYYIDEANKVRMQKIDKDHFMDIYQLQIIQRCFKACGSFSSFYNTRNDTRYLKYLKSTLKTVKFTLLKHPKYTGFIELFEKYNIENFEYQSKK